MGEYEEVIQQNPAERKEKRIGNYIIDKTLGKGTFGKVKLAIHEPTGEKVAIKILEKDKIIDVADVERVTREIHILKLIRHPNIIQLYEIIQSPKHLFLVMEYMQNGELFNYILEKRKMDEQEAGKVFEQIVSGIEYTHKMKIVHRDLKLENILMDYDHTIRIVDFGLSNTYKVNEHLRTACGSPCYAAPEMIEGKNPYEPIMVDIWSAGVILYAMVCGCLPFEDNDTPKLYKKIINGEYSIPSHLSPNLKDFIRKVLNVNPNERFRVADMKSHPWWTAYSARNYYAEGLIVGYHKIPIDRNILKQLRHLNLDVDLAEKSLQANRHNNLTTTYYLIMKKYINSGGVSKADFSGKQFDKLAIEPSERRKKSTGLKASDLIKIASPSNEKKKKSFYLGMSNHINKETEEKNHTNLSMNMKMGKKRKSHSKSNVKNKSMLHENSHINKSFKENSHNHPKMSKSSSKKKRSPKRDVSINADHYHRPRAISHHPNKKSHQGSHNIGIQSGVDWPLEPKYKANENGAKIKNALRKR